MHIQLVLLQRVEGLGIMGDVVKVRRGFASNFLLPKKLALRATTKNLELFEKQRAALEAENISRRNEAQAIAAKMDGLSVIMIRSAGDSGQLYGSVNARDISQAITEAGFIINKNQVQITSPIKTLGIYAVRVVLHPEVSTDVTVNVAKSEQEALAAEKQTPQQDENLHQPAEDLEETTVNGNS